VTLRLLLPLLFACGFFATEEDKVKATISEMVAAAAAPDLGGVLDPISEHYKDGDGVTKDQLRGFLFRQFQTKGPVVSVLSPIAVQHEEGSDTATASFEAIIALGITLGDPIPDNADAFRFTVDLEKQDGDWMIVSHTRASATGTEITISE
jgi:hypothetical protein